MDGNSPDVLAGLAFAQVYRDHFGFVCRSARSLGTPLSALDDVVQEIFVVVHRRLDELESRASLRAWLSGIVLNVVRHHRRSLFRRSPQELARSEREDPDLLPARIPDPHDAALLAEGSRLLQRLLETLDDEKREVFVLAELEELSVPQIASALGLKLNTTYSRLRLAREQFARALSRHRARERGAALGLLPGLVATKASGALGGWGAAGLAAKWLVVGAVLGATATAVLSQPEPSTRASETPARQAPGPRPTPTSASVPRAAPDPPSAANESSAVAAGSVPRAPKVAATSDAQLTLPGTVAEEARLLREAHQLLGQGDAAGALRSLEHHERTFPRSVLDTERQVEKISALCGLGRVEAARAAASSFLLASPESPLAGAVRQSCGAPPLSQGEFE